MDLIKKVIVEKRNEGYTFKQISEYLKTEYDIEKSRQAIHGIYTRYNTKDEKDKIDTETKIDILNLYVMGYSINQINKELQVSAYKIKKVIDTEKSDDLRLYKMDIIIKALMNSKSLTEVKEKLKYKKWEIAEKGLKLLVSDAITILIEKQVTNTLRELKETGISSETLTRSLGTFKERYTIPKIVLKDK